VTGPYRAHVILRSLTDGLLYVRNAAFELV
jgi:hypothetical protein